MQFTNLVKTGVTDAIKMQIYRTRL